MLSGVVQERSEVVGDHPFFATAYPASSAMTSGRPVGVAAGSVSGAVALDRTGVEPSANGTPLTSLTAGQLAGLANGIVYYVSAGAAVGLVSRVLARSRRELNAAREEATRERVRAARMSERESLGRQIHDSVLQSLAMVNKRGRELAALPTRPGRGGGPPGRDRGRAGARAARHGRRRARRAPRGNRRASNRPAVRRVRRLRDRRLRDDRRSRSGWRPRRWKNSRRRSDRRSRTSSSTPSASRATVFGELDDG